MSAKKRNDHLSSESIFILVPGIAMTIVPFYLLSSTDEKLGFSFYFFLIPGIAFLVGGFSMLVGAYNIKLKSIAEKLGVNSIIALSIIGFLGICLFAGNARYIFRTALPITRVDEYFIDKNNVIHNGGCYYNDAPWFTEKHDKYTFVKRNRYSFCYGCFRYEETEMMMELHDYNMEQWMLRFEEWELTEEQKESWLDGIMNGNL